MWTADKPKPFSAARHKNNRERWDVVLEETQDAWMRVSGGIWKRFHYSCYVVKLDICFFTFPSEVRWNCWSSSNKKEKKAHLPHVVSAAQKEIHKVHNISKFWTQSEVARSVLSVNTADRLTRLLANKLNHVNQTRCGRTEIKLLLVFLSVKPGSDHRTDFIIRFHSTHKKEFHRCSSL